jgi:aminocarboxymuconate-semialdehyde decarboxylase
VTTTHLAIDVHGHAVPETVLTLIERDGQKFGGITLDRADGRDIITLPGGDPLRPLPAGMTPGTARADWMAEQGVVTQLVGPWMDIQGNGLPPEHGIPWSSALNDAMAEGLPQLHADNRLLATVYPPDPAAAAREMARARDELGAIGVMLATHWPGGSADEDAMEPFWEAAADQRIPVVLHPPIVGPASAIPGNPDFRSLYGRPLETTFVATRMLVNGVLERYPDLRIVLVHGGGFLPFQAGRLDQQVADGKLKTRLPGNRVPSSYIRNFYFDTAMLDPTAVKFLEDYAPGRVLIGTDHPFTAKTSDVPGQIDFLDESRRDRVASAVARELFGITN